MGKETTKLGHVKVVSNKDKTEEELAQAIAVGMIACAETAAGHAIVACAVDTGRLRNSITGAVNQPKKGLVQTAANTNDGVSATRQEYKVLSMPEENSMTIGTNVEYAQYIELGHSEQSPNGFLGIALTEHLNEYKMLLERELKGK